MRLYVVLCDVDAYSDSSWKHTEHEIIGAFTDAMQAQMMLSLHQQDELHKMTHGDAYIQSIGVDISSDTPAREMGE